MMTLNARSIIQKSFAALIIFFLLIAGMGSLNLPTAYAQEKEVGQSLAQQTAISTRTPLTPTETHLSKPKPTKVAPISALIPLSNSLPSQIDLSAGMPPVGTQGRGDSTSWAVAYYYKSYQEKKNYNWGYNDAHIFSPGYLYNQHGFTDQNGPSSSEYAFLDLVSQGVSSLATFPYDIVSYPLPLPSQTALDEASNYKASGYQQIYGQNNSSGFVAVENLKAHLATGDPFVMDIPLYGTGLPNNGDWNNLIPQHVPTVIDIPGPSSFQIYNRGHAITVVGYDDSTQRFKFINSWGTGWGNNGYGYITYGFVVKSFPYEAYAMTDIINPPVGPHSPSNLIANSVSSSQIDLSWSSSPDSVDGYQVWSGGAIIANNVTSTNYSLTGLESCSSYSFYVTAYIGNSTSSASNLASAQTSGCLSGAPSAPSLSSPSNGQVFPRVGDITLNWNSNGSSSYLPEYWGGPNGGKSNLGWQSGTSQFFGNSDPGGYYSWHVKAKDIAGKSSDWGETRTFFKKYGTPGNFGVSANSDNHAQLTWDASVDAPGNIQGYKIYRDGQLLSYLGSTAISYDDSGLNCNTTYSYYITAFNRSDESDQSSSVSVKTNACPVPIPSAYFDASPLIGNAPLTVSMHIIDMSNITSCSWNYGDGQTSTTCTQLHDHIYNSLGLYTVTLTVYGAGGSKSFTMTNYINVTNQLPDLVVQSFLTSPVSPTVNQPVTFTVRIKNQGTADITVPFYVDFFIDQAPGSCPTDGIDYWSIGSLAAGATLDLPYTYAGFSTSGGHNLYAIADSYCATPDSNRTNNILGPVAINVQTATPTFADVPYNYSVVYGGVTYYLHDYIQALYAGGLTNGCNSNPLSYCPDNTLKRVESAKFMLSAMQGTSYTPPTDPSGYVFQDDWSSPSVSWGRAWAEGLWDVGLTNGCSANPLLFCPAKILIRDEWATFGLRIKYGGSYTPPAASHIFADDWSSPSVSWAEPWAEKAYLDGLLPACGSSGGKPLFCPTDLVTRAWAAYMIVNAKGLTPVH